jgi:hypothetical protein
MASLGACAVRGIGVRGRAPDVSLMGDNRKSNVLYKCLKCGRIFAPHHGRGALSVRRCA